MPRGALSPTRMTDVPAAVDVREELEDVRRGTDDEAVAETVASVRESLETFAQRDVADRQGVLDEVANELLRLEETTDGDAQRQVRAALNRVQQYRDARASADDAVVPLTTDVDLPARAATLADAAPAAGAAEFEVTVVNEGPARTFDVRLAFADADGQRLETVETSDESVDAKGETTVSLAAEVPDAAASYDVRATATGGRG